MTFADAKQRFSNRVTDYVRYRLGYPAEILPLLQTWTSLRPDHVVADIGSGTGLLSKLFLDFGNRVLGVEPNAEMRAAGEEFLSEYPNFKSVAGSAEATTLPSGSVDFIAAGQAFHWFQMPVARNEFRRILKSGGRVLVIWNERLLDETAFLREYEALLNRFGTDYAKVSESYPRAEQMLEFYGPNDFTSHSLPNFQEFDFDGLSGRLRSSSYAPPAGHPLFEPMMKELRRLFDAHHQGDVVRM
ncbi:MAG TPA: class I SAM-dependent methyltransferase, partial [Candidatus Acidoferrum sp.]|nr:class I SAM-dependent methyltransferase [Candidatus Acidoferrum sp.]